MNLHNFLNTQAVKTKDGLTQHIFAQARHDYEGDPNLTVTGLVLVDDQNNVKQLVAECFLSNTPSTGLIYAQITYEVKFDIDDLTGPDAALNIQKKIIESQANILKILDKELDLLSIDYEIAHINNWDQITLLKEHPELSGEFNCTFLSYWGSIKLQETVLKWAEKLAA